MRLGCKETNTMTLLMQQIWVVAIINSSSHFAEKGVSANFHYPKTYLTKHLCLIWVMSSPDGVKLTTRPQLKQLTCQLDPWLSYTVLYADVSEWHLLHFTLW